MVNRKTLATRISKMVDRRVSKPTCSGSGLSLNWWYKRANLHILEWKAP
eukprot:COSAG01_NODE_43788_length_426_cov_0.785933_1_plen_48_part_01